MEPHARLFHCLRCHCQVLICSHCDRGNLYCFGECSRTARKESRRSAGQRYQQTPQGKRNHAARQQRYLEQKKIKMTHQGSQENDDPAHSPPQSATVISGLHCHFCNKQVSEYLRSDFLERGPRARHDVFAQGP